MDIWAWVGETSNALREDGRERLAELVERVPFLVCRDRHDEVDAILPEALALAREAGSPWLELFLRHWHLQSRVLHRADVASALGEAVRLVEFAHRDETRDCPQSVCVTQDLTACYAAMDGPGYAPERIATSREALGRIDSRWPCFVCISGELADAFVDAGRSEEALEFLDEQVRALRRAGGREADLYRWSSHRSRALLALGRAEEAVAAIEEAEPFTHENPSLSRGNASRKARALAMLGRLEEAPRALVPIEDVLPTPSLHPDYGRALVALVDSGAVPNDLSVDLQLSQLAAALERAGAVRWAFEIALARARLSVGRGRRAVAEFSARDAARLIERLRHPETGRPDLERVGRRIEAARLEAVEPELPPDPEALVERLGRDPEQDLELLAAARRRWPEAEDLVQWEAAALSAIGRHDFARDALEGHLAGRPESHEVRLQLAEVLLQAEEPDRARDVAREGLERELPDETAASFHWVVARSRLAEGDLAGGRDDLTSVLRHDPDSIEARLVLAELDRASGDPHAAMRWLDEAVALEKEPGDADWSRIVIGTLLGDWSRVRESSGRLGLDLSGSEGPVEEDWGPCRVRIPEEDGSRSEVLAVRTGPASAVVVQISPPGSVQHFSDHAVIDPRTEETPDEDEDDEEEHSVFEAVAYAAAGFETLAVEGIDPGQDALEALVERLEDMDCAVEVYRETEGGTWLGLLVAVPPGADRSRVEAVLESLPGRD